MENFKMQRCLILCSSERTRRQDVFIESQAQFVGKLWLKTASKATHVPFVVIEGLLFRNPFCSGLQTFLHE